MDDTRLPGICMQLPSSLPSFALALFALRMCSICRSFPINHGAYFLHFISQFIHIVAVYMKKKEKIACFSLVGLQEVVF